MSVNILLKIKVNTLLKHTRIQPVKTFTYIFLNVRIPIKWNMTAEVKRIACHRFALLKKIKLPAFMP
ncbi:hypothetical protein AXE65_00585 [Ventosimonas gracilis]|uniref:Uncharacterized protein n=1 Tax=Ventosimonas gracilis TaxID=1680762 RepID=A0A139SRK9_9GAMM|nr:hypothetical protein AXE65_00585 [Ventosimonas gracilis]